MNRDQNHANHLRFDPDAGIVLPYGLQASADVHDGCIADTMIVTAHNK